MILYHFSDNHGSFIGLKNFVDRKGLPDVFVLTGDFFPNCGSNYSMDRATEFVWQECWLLKHIEEFKKILGGKPLMFCLGNHDFADLAEICNREGIDARKVPSTGIEAFGYKWAGFGHVPYYYGYWNREANDKVLGILTGEVIKAQPDILLTHCPPYNIMDKTRWGDKIGNRPLYGALANGQLKPKYHFFGHVHEFGGRIETIEDVVYVNSATTVQRIEI